MTTATVAIQPSENLSRFPTTSRASLSSSAPWVTTMNETQQMHATDSSQQQSTNNASSIHNNNNNINSSTGGKNRSSSQSDAKMEHHFQLLQREREHQQQQQRERDQQQQRESQQHHQQSSSTTSATMSHQQQREHREQRERERDREREREMHQQQQQREQQHQHRPFSPTPSEQQQYALKWNDFQSSILSSFRHLRDEEDFVDVTIACEQRSFTAHKVVLSACSPYFRKLLKANPCEHPIVILRDVRSEDIESLLRFMYNGEVHIGQDQLSDFLKTAQLLQVRGLADVTNPGRMSSTGGGGGGGGSGNIGGGIGASAALNSSSLSTPAVQELKASPTSSSLPWEPPEDGSAVPPPQKRTKSSELYRKQHGLSPDDPIPLEHFPIGQHPLTRERSKDKSKDLRSNASIAGSEFDVRDRDRSLESHKESLLSQKHPDLPSFQNAIDGEDSNSSDTAASDHGDDIEGINGNVEHTRPSFPFLGLQGIPGLIPGPSGMHGDNFDARQHCDTLIKEEAIVDDEDDEVEQRQRRHHQHQVQHHHQQQQQQQQRSCPSASIDGVMGGGPRGQDGPKYEPDDNDSRFDEDEEDEDAMEDEDMKDDAMSNATMDSDYHKQLAAAGVLAAAAAAASGNANALGDGSEQNDFFAAHKSGSRDLALKQHILNEKARLQAHIQRHQQQLAGFLLSTTAAAATTPPTSTPQNCANQSANSTTSPFMSTISSLNRTGTGNTVNSSSANNSFTHDGAKSQKQSQQQSDRTNLFAYNNSSNTGQVYLLPCPLCEVPLEPRVFRQHLDRHYPRDSPVCPVIQCGRRFAHPNSVRNHMRLKHTSQWAKMKAMRSSGGPFTGIP